MSILNEIERAVICGKQEYRTNNDFIDAIEQAVIAKLAAGVSVEPVGSFHVTHFKQSFCMRNIEFQEHIDFAAGDHYLYSAEQLAAARVQENVRCAFLCQELGDGDSAYAIRALIGETK